MFKISPIPLTLRFKKKIFIFLLNFTLIALFFKAYAVEADIGLLAFYLHLPEQDPEGLRFVWDELARSRPEDFPRRVASFRIIRQDSFFLVKLKKKSLSSFGLLLATRGGYPHVSQSDVHFFVMGILERKVWNSTSPYTLTL